MQHLRTARLTSIRGGLLLALLAILPLTACVSSSPAQREAAAKRAVLPIHVEEISEQVDGKPIRGWAAKVDLRDPRVEIRVTGPIAARPDDPPGSEAHTETTPAWLDQEGLVLAVNTHFFRRLDDPKQKVPDDFPVDLDGPCISDGRTISGERDDGKPAPTLAITRQRQARIGMLVMSDLAGMDDAVCGISASGTQDGGLLVEDGRNVGATALPRPQERHPRTAAGLTPDRHTLILVVVDGRQPDWSFGLTLPELGNLMLRLGADEAINLDGGGSSSFVFAPPDGPRITNRPSDGHWRPVGASMGVQITAPR